MNHFRLLIILVVLVSVIDRATSRPLQDLFNDLVRKEEDIKNKQLLDFISKSVPQGFDKPDPKVAEYETFKSDRSANFITDGKGIVRFRQFKRLRLADVFNRRGLTGI